MAVEVEARPAPAKKPVQRVSQLKKVIKGAARGDEQHIRQLVSPFLCDGETVLDCAVTAKLGLIPTYDFAFLTDRRIGDLQITPLTGNLSVEVAYLHKIDAFVLIQPAFPILLRLFMVLLYLVAPLVAMGPVFSTRTFLALFLGTVAIVLFNTLVAVAIIPIIKRVYLRFKKSGIWLKLTGSHMGVLIFADRDKFAVLTRLSRRMSEVKRQLDKEAA
jgi:hypothetical protein